MEVYFDKKFVKVFFQLLVANSNPHLISFELFLKKLAGFKTYINVDTVKDITDDIVLKRALNVPINVPQIDSSFLNKIAEPSFYNNGTAFRLFFVEIPETKSLRKKFGYYFFNSNDILAEWGKINSVFEEYAITIHPGNKQLEDWKFLHKYQHPINSIVVVDRYMLKTVATARENILPLLHQLLKNNENVLIKLTIITNYRDNYKNIHYPIKECELMIKDNLKNKGFNVQVELYNLDNQEHARGLLTNYWYMNPGSSFDIFRNGKIVVNDNLYLNFNFKKPGKTLTEELVKRLRNHLTKSNEKSKNQLLIN